MAAITLESHGWQIQVDIPPPHHYLIGQGDFSEMPDVDALAVIGVPIGGGIPLGIGDDLGMQYLQIDLNQRSPDGYSPAHYTGSTPSIGDPVAVFESEDGVKADGRVVDVDVKRGIALIDVQWDSLTDYQNRRTAGTRNGPASGKSRRAASS